MPFEKCDPTKIKPYEEYLALAYVHLTKSVLNYKVEYGKSNVD